MLWIRCCTSMPVTSLLPGLMSLFPAVICRRSIFPVWSMYSTHRFILWPATTIFDTKTNYRKVVSISGDGGFGQYLAEINTAVKYGMNITHVLMNNGELGKISKEQRAGNWEVWQTSLHNPDFSAYAELCGALGIRVTKADELDAAFEKALRHPGPALVEVMTDAELV